MTNQPFMKVSGHRKGGVYAYPGGLKLAVINPQ